MCKYILILLWSMSITSYGQEHWEMTFKPRLNFPADQILDNDLRIGNGLELAASYNVMPHFKVVVAWGWYQYDTDQAFNETNIDFEESGWSISGIFILPINHIKTKYYIKIGGIFHQLKIQEDNNTIEDRTDHGLGWQIGSGVFIKVYNHWKINPELVYRSVSPNLSMDNEIMKIDIRYISLGVGLIYSF